MGHRVDKAIEEADVSWSRAMELADAQASRGRYFVGEHCLKGQSWERQGLGRWMGLEDGNDRLRG